MLKTEVTLLYYKNLLLWVEAGDFLNFPIQSPKMLIVLMHLTFGTFPAYPSYKHFLI